MKVKKHGRATIQQIKVDNSVSDGSSSELDNNDNDNISNEINKAKLTPKNQAFKRKNQQINNNENNKKIKFNKQLYKPPTVEEINELQETENLFHSHLFRMQINEMLKEVKIKENYKKYTQQWLIEFNKFLKNLESSPDKEISTNISWLQETNIQVPLEKFYKIGNCGEKSWYFQFLKPTKEAFITGSMINQTIIGSILMVDICVLMPSKCFQKEDYLNLIYDKKKALYLTYLAWKLKENSTNELNFTQLKFNYYKNNQLKPILIIEPIGKIGKKINFRIFISPEGDSFKLNRFVPWNSNIRENFLGKYCKNPEDEQIYATPNYNSYVLFDLTMKENHQFLENILHEHKNLQDGLILLKIWLTQRNLNSGYTGFNNFIMSMLVGYLIKIKKLHAAMSSYQIARNTWNYLAGSSWNEEGKGISLFSSSITQSNQPNLEQFHAYYDVVFIDTSGFLNLTANLSLDVYNKVKYEAQRAIQLLNNKNVNSFELLFMEKTSIYTTFDHILRISDSKTIKFIVKNHCENSDKCNFAGMWFPLVLKKITNLLRKGLSNRILSMLPIEKESMSWDIDVIPKPLQKCFSLGFTLNPETAYNILTTCPEDADEIATEEFRKFWGKKATLRRFKDSSIKEACAWSSGDQILSKKRLITHHIIYYILNNHLSVKLNCLEYFAMQLDKVYELNKIFYSLNKNNKLKSIDAESTTLKVIRSFDELRSNLRELNELALDITSVQGLSSLFCYTDPIPTLNNAKTFIYDDKLIFQSYKIIDGIIQLGFSGKWPDDLPAFRRIKTAFHIQIAEQLRKKFKYQTRGSIEGVYVLKDGYVFRLEIAHQKEIILTKKSEVVKGITSYTETSESLELEKRFNFKPKIISALHGLYQMNTSFGPATMIAKRWLYLQLIDSYLWPDECTELLMAWLYLNTNINENPYQPQTGFFRFLNLLANTDWRNKLFLLNFNKEISEEDITGIEKRFNTDRDSFPPLTIMTSCDLSRVGVWSSDKSPTVQILARITILARYSLKLIDQIFDCKQTCTNINFDNLFKANLDGYDAVIKLRKKHIHPSIVNNFEVKATKLNTKIISEIPVVDFDPVTIGLNELREGFSNFAVFFYNPCGGREIYVIWKPNIFVEKDFNVTSVNGCHVTQNNQIKCSRKQLLEDFQIILQDLCNSIEDRRFEYDSD